MSERIGVIGLGYVGLPLALAFAGAGFETVGYDSDKQRVSSLLAEHPGAWTHSPRRLKGCTVYIVCVPTPVDTHHQPDLGSLMQACDDIGSVIRNGAVVVIESTVAPGMTEGVCGREIARASGLRQGVDFFMAYSPERINPGDSEHTLAKVVKVVAAEDNATLDRVAELYGSIIKAGIHRAPSIRVAEAAKCLENVQRDVNIALMNECAQMFEHLGIETRDVLAAARTKWNFLDFKPGLVGGHCISVDPYYLAAASEERGYHPELILAARRINDSMSEFIARKMAKMLSQEGCPTAGARVAILGMTYKPDVSDCRNSRVIDIVDELILYGVNPLVHDPLVDPVVANETYGIKLWALEELTDLDGSILAVPQRIAGLKPGGALIDVCGVLDREQIPEGVEYYSL
jgi:UDP-N-acetyl-D-galactosamine dehydrogenase